MVVRRRPKARRNSSLWLPVGPPVPVGSSGGIQGRETKNPPCGGFFVLYQDASAAFRRARRMAFRRFIRFLTEGFVKYARFLNSFSTPERSYFFLKRFIARSMGSFSETTMPTNRVTSLRGHSWGSGSIATFSRSRRSPSRSNDTTMALPPPEVRSLEMILPISSQSV